MAQIIFIVLCSGIVGSYLTKGPRYFGETIIMVFNMVAVLVNAMVLMGNLNVPVA